MRLVRRALHIRGRLWAAAPVSLTASLPSLPPSPSQGPWTGWWRRNSATWRCCTASQTCPPGAQLCPGHACSGPLGWANCSLRPRCCCLSVPNVLLTHFHSHHDPHPPHTHPTPSAGTLSRAPRSGRWRSTSPCRSPPACCPRGAARPLPRCAASSGRSQSQRSLPCHAIFPIYLFPSPSPHHPVVGPRACRPAPQARSTARWEPAASPWSTSPTCPSSWANGWLATTQPTGGGQCPGARPGSTPAHAPARLWLPELSGGRARTQPHAGAAVAASGAQVSFGGPSNQLCTLFIAHLRAAPPPAAAAWSPTASSPRRRWSTTWRGTTRGRG